MMKLKKAIDERNLELIVDYVKMNKEFIDSLRMREDLMYYGLDYETSEKICYYTYKGVDVEW